MVMKKGSKKGAKRAWKKRPARRARRAPTSRVGNWASCVDVRDLGYDTNGSIVKVSQFSLSSFSRAINIASSYQYYRIKLIEMKFIPTADTYIAGTTPGEVPNLYYVIDKTDAIPQVGATVNTLQQAGARPIRFDDKTITVRFKPAVLYNGYDEVGGNSNFALSRVSPWLSTNDSNTSNTASWVANSSDHHGIMYTVTGGTAGQNYRVEMVAHFEFKKPLFYVTPEPGVALPPVYEKRINATTIENVLLNPTP